MGVKARGRRYLLLADEDLISLVDRDEPGAFAALYDRHSRAAYSLAYRMVGERQAAEDLVQEVFLKVWRGAGGYRAERGSVRTWLLSMVHNRGVDLLRARASRRRTQDRIEASAALSEPSEAFDETWLNTRRDQVREALKGLPREQSKIFELAYFSGHTHVEIARLLNLPLGTVKGRMRLGLRKMRSSPISWEAADVGRLGRETQALASSAVGGLLPPGPANPISAEAHRNRASATAHKPAAAL